MPEGAPQALVRVAAAELQALAPRELRDTLTADTVGRAAQAVSELAQLTIERGGRHRAQQAPLVPRATPSSSNTLARHSARGSGTAWVTASDLKRGPATLDATSTAKCARLTARKRPRWSSTHAPGRPSTGSEFTLEDLLTGEPRPAGRRSAGVQGAACTIAEASAWKLLNGGRTLAAQIPGPDARSASTSPASSSARRRSTS